MRTDENKITEGHINGKTQTKFFLIKYSKKDLMNIKFCEHYLREIAKTYVAKRIDFLCSCKSYYRKNFKKCTNSQNYCRKNYLKFFAKRNR